MMLYGPLRPFRQRFAKDLRQGGGIWRRVVEVDVRRDDRLDRPRTRFAVSRFATQIGASILWMWLGLISAIVRSPIVG